MTDWMNPDEREAAMAAKWAQAEAELSRTQTELAETKAAFHDHLQNYGAMLAQLDAVRTALPNFELNGSDAPAQIRGILSDLEHTHQKLLRATATLAEAHDYCLQMLPPEWYADRKNRGTFAAGVFAILEAKKE